VHEGVADLELALGRQLRHACRGAGAAGRAVDRLVAIEHRVARVRALGLWRAGPQDVAEPLDGRVLGMLEGVFGIEVLAQHRAHLHQLAGGEIRHVAIARLRLDDGVEVAAIGHVHLERADPRALRLEPGRMQEPRHVGQPHGFDIFALLFVLRDHQAGRRL
jgi:hypothetical protein